MLYMAKFKGSTDFFFRFGNSYDLFFCFSFFYKFRLALFLPCSSVAKLEFLEKMFDF